MKNKKCFRMAAMVLTVALLLTAVMPLTAFAYTGETEAVAESSVPEEKETSDTEASSEELTYTITEQEDGTISIAIGGKEWSFNADEEAVRTGEVVNVGSYLHLRTGAGMNYEIIGHLLNGDKVEVIGQDGEWYQVVVPEHTGYVHSDYLKVMEQTAGENSEIDGEMLSMLLAMMMLGSNTGGNATPLTPDGNMTLVDDIGSATAAGQQFITVESKAGNTFYLVIDRNDKGEENVHFLNQVDEADLLALMEGDQPKSECNCAEKCKAGSVNMNCPVCKNDMSKCVGVEKAEPKPTPDPEPTEEPKPEKSSGVGGLMVFLLIALGGAGAAVWYFKFRKPKADTKGSDDLDDYDFGDEDDDDVDYVPDDDDVDTSEESED